MRARKVLSSAAVVMVGAVALTACDDVSSLNRPAAPVVLTGSQVSAVVGVDPGDLVAFRHVKVDGAPTWQQIPVQVDQRKVVAFGIQPGSNATPGVNGTVYGNGSGGPTALQYADAGTFVGADSDPLIDANDEIVFMASDAGGKPADDAQTEPAGVLAGSGVALAVTDPRGSNERGWVYLFESAGSLDPAAGKDYVDYDFVLTSGDYKTTYKRADGPNPETSKVTTANYEIGFSDRWKEDSWKVLGGTSTKVDILDGHKNQFAISVCGRSNQTFADAEGAFVANIDGPVRAIRSYVGANSGPLTQRTHLMYASREDVITDLRVHSIPSIMDFLDFSAAANGLTYRSSTVPNGVTIDGIADAVPTATPSWEAVDGPQGRVYTKSVFTSSAGALGGPAVHFHRDQTSPSEAQCWGDGSYFGATGAHLQGGIANTDPREATVATLQGVRVNQFLPPAGLPGNVASYAADWALDLGQPLTVAVTAYQP
jgi:hypothetical protein